MGGQDYARLTRRLKALNLPCMETAGVVDGFPIYRILLEGGPGGRRVLLSAGIHGDEPAGPEAVLCFLERDAADLLPHFTFLILPCINPYGYVHNRRENRKGEDINRSFADDVAESNIVKQVLEGQRFDLFVDLHEDWEATGFYMYEGRRDEAWVGPEIVCEVEKIGAIDRDSGESESDIPISEGVFKADPAWGTRGIVSYVHRYHAEHVVIFETPTSWPLKQRTAAHLTALDAILERYVT